MKQEHSQLSQEAHECVDSIPELNKMVTGVQALGRFGYTINWLVLRNTLFYAHSCFWTAVAQCEDFKMKYVEEQAKRKELYNQIQETKGMFFPLVVIICCIICREFRIKGT